MKAKIIVITGAIGSGKSQALEIGEKLGFSVFSADEYSKDIYQGKLLKEVEKHFPEVVKDGKLDRKALAKIISQDEKKRLILNKISHGEILKRMKKDIDKDGAGIKLVEIPLFAEVRDQIKEDYQLLKVFYIDADKKTRIDRLAKREGIKPQTAELLIDGQKKDYLNRQFADKIVSNNSTKEEFEKKFTQELEVLNESI